jgi:hypothetical protein
MARHTKIANLIQTPEGIPEPDRMNDLVYFSLAPDEFSESVFESLSSWARATQPKESKPSEPKRATADLDDEIPF